MSSFATSRLRPSRLALSLILVTLLGVTLLPGSSAHNNNEGYFAFGNFGSSNGGGSAAQRVSGESLRKMLTESVVVNPASPSSFLLPQAGPSPETLETFAADCTTPKTSFILGETVCAKLSGGPSVIARRLSWAQPDNSVARTIDVASDPQTDLFALPASSPTVDYRGVWRVNDISLSRSIGRRSASFTVSDPADLVTNLAVYNNLNTNPSVIVAGTNVEFALWLTNRGPDTATDVEVLDTVAADATFVEAQQDSGPAFSCSPGTGGVSCTIASLAAGQSARIRVIFQSNTAATAGTLISTTATISSALAEQNNTDNTSTADVKITTASGGGVCNLDCPANKTVNADTTEGGVRGAHVTYDAPASDGDCGSITTTPASGSFFPVGSTTVSATSATGGGSCDFVITVEEASGNTTISCPASQETTANSNCEANVVIGTPTATGDNVTIVGVRSDGKPLYNCDCFPPDPLDPSVACNINGACSRKPDAPFGAGVTTILWTAYSHDTPGPYLNPDDEEAHRTGSASCTQTITVNDVVPPTITPPANQSASVDGSCQLVLPDFTTSATVSDNCACSASDNSETCVDREPITITQSPAPGTLVGLGPITITLTANDGSSNNDGAGNTATAQFTLTVVDSTPPVISCPGAITVNNDAGLCSATVNPGTASATDNCDATPTINGTRSDNQALNAPYPVGTTTITWTATDDANNSSSCTQTITVNDTQLPTISCPTSITLEPTCPTGAIATYTAPVGADNCPGATTTRTAGLASGSVFPIGTTTVTYTVNDAHGNSASCSFTVTVLTPQAVLQNLINTINSLPLSGTQKQGLISKLNAAIDAINQGKQNVACNKLADFISQVSGFISNGTLTAALGQPLINSANHVRNNIGCTNLGCS